MAHDIFISYASEDKNIADAVCAKLEEREIRCWIAPRDILPGANWGESIVDAISDCKIMVFVFSSNSNRSQHVFHEIERAVDKEVTIIPFRVENVLPSKTIEFFISAKHWLDAITPPLEKHLKTLADKVSQVIVDPRQPPPPPPVRMKSRLKPVLAIVAVLLIAVGAIWLVPGGSREDKIPVAESTKSPGETPPETPPGMEIPEDSQPPKREGKTEKIDTPTPPQEPPRTPEVSQKDVEPNESRIDANRILVDGAVSGEIGKEKDKEDWFQVSIPENGLFHFNLENLHKPGVQNGNINHVFLWDDGQIPMTGTAGWVGPEASQSISPVSVSRGQSCYIQIKPYDDKCSAPYTLGCTFKAMDRLDVGEPNQSKNRAHLLSPDDSKDALVGYGGDSCDWYKIVMPSDGLFHFSFKNRHESRVQFGNIKQVFLWGDGDKPLTWTAGWFGPGSSQAISPVSVSRGQSCYIQIKPYDDKCSAPYTLGCTFKALDKVDAGEPNQSKNGANEMSPNTSKNALIGYGGDTEDWYKIVMPSNGLFHFSFENLHKSGVQHGNINQVLLWGDGEKPIAWTAGWFGPGSSQSISPVSVSRGQSYCIQIKPLDDNFSAPYTLGCTFKAQEKSDKVEPNQSKNKAHELNPNDNMNALIGYGGDSEDWYKIVMPSNGLFHFTFNNQHESGIQNGNINQVFLWGDGDKPLTWTAGWIGPGASQSIAPVSVSRGQSCYIQIKPLDGNCSAPYTLGCTFKALDRPDEGEPNQSKNKAQELNPNGRMNALIGYGGDTEDWFKIVIPSNGLFHFTFKNRHELGVQHGNINHVFLWDNGGKLLISSAGWFGPEANQTIPSVSVARGREYYIQIKPLDGKCSAPYTLECAFKPLSIPDAGEPNQDRNSAHVVNPNDDVVALIGFGNDQEDWYRIEMPSNGTFHFVFKNLHERDVWQGQINSVLLLDKNGKPLAATHGFNPGNSHTCTARTVTKGEVFYIQVKPLSATCSAPYEIDMNLSPSK